MKLASSAFLSSAISYRNYSNERFPSRAHDRACAVLHRRPGVGLAGRGLFCRPAAGHGRGPGAQAAAPAAAGGRARRGKGSADMAQVEREVYQDRYLIRRPLLQALQAPEPGAVLLIDEVDRADEPFEAFLLEYLGEYQVSIPEIGTVRATATPVTILTSNRTRDLHDAVKRRCLYH